jgi:hypothetical protein
VNICQNGTAVLVRMKDDVRDKCHVKTLERVKGIEPSYSAWKSPNFPNVFIVSSDKSRPSGPLGSLQNFSQSEWPEVLRVATVQRRETNLATATIDAALHAGLVPHTCFGERNPRILTLGAFYCAPPAYSATAHYLGWGKQLSDDRQARRSAAT